MFQMHVVRYYYWEHEMEINSYLFFSVMMNVLCRNYCLYMSDLEEILRYRMVQIWEKDRCGGNLYEVLWYFLC